MLSGNITFTSYHPHPPHLTRMGFASAFRRVLSPPPRNPPRRPRPARRPKQLTQEQVVIESYRDHLNHLARTLNKRWAAFDAEPDDFTIVNELRHLRQQLTTALESYHAAMGAANNSRVPYVVTTMDTTDRRLVQLDKQVTAEVDRFEFASLDIASRYAAALHPPAKTHAAADAHDLLVELELYRETWASIMDSAARNSLDHSHGVLREIVDRQQTSPHRPPHFYPPRPQSHPHSQTSTYTPWSPSTSPDRPRPPQFRPNVPSPSPSNPPFPPIGANDGFASADREYGSSESGDDGPMQMVISRSRTLRDVVEDVMTTTEQDAQKLSVDPRISSSQMLPSPGASVDQPNLSVAKNMSFASTLYHTRHARADAISDAGVMLRRSNVRGDGRCMFRAIARGRIAVSESPIPSERIEREAADELRARAVVELKKHRRLLAKFFVIEGDFDQYTRKMSYPKTYGGEPELLMLAKLLHAPIAVYIQKDGTYRQIQVYGKQYRGDPLRILYSDGVHYDALLAIRYA